MHNKFADVLTFLQAQGMPKLIGKNDHPRFIEQEVDIYKDDELSKLHAACSRDDLNIDRSCPVALQTGNHPGRDGLEVQIGQSKGLPVLRAFMHAVPAHALAVMLLFRFHSARPFRVAAYKG